MDTADVAARNDLNYTSVAALAFMSWDVLIHLSSEVEFIWLGPHSWYSWVKWLYAFLRYFPIFHGGAVLTLNEPHTYTYTPAACRAWLIYELAFMEALTVAAEVVLTMRLYFLYNSNKLILWTIILAFIAEVSAMIVILCLSMPRIQFNSVSFPAPGEGEAGVCLVGGTPDFFVMYWLLSLGFEALLFGLTLLAFTRNVMRHLGRQSFLFLFVRDGTWAFAIIFVTMVLNAVLYKLCTNPRAGMGYFWALAAMSFAGSHVLLNMRRLRRQDTLHELFSGEGQEEEEEEGVEFQDLHHGYGHHDQGDGDCPEERAEPEAIASGSKPSAYDPP